RNYLHENNFYDIETPFLIKSTPEGARDFVVPSRMNAGEFYALPQSPQTFKQLLMVSGYDRYYQIVKCFRDEDLRADRQPEFTQIDCEMAFVEQEDIINMFEGLVKRIFKDVKGIDYTERVERISWEDAMWNYGNDKPDTRFEMKITNFKKPVSVYTNKTTNNALIDNANFVVFDAAETVLAIGVANCSEYTRKQTDELTEWVKRPQIGMKGLAFIKVNSDGSYKSSIDKFYDTERLKAIADATNAKAGDLILILAGNEERTRKAMSELRLEMAKRLHKREFKFGIKILNRKRQLQSNRPIYSLEISSEKIKNNRDKLLLIAKNESLSNASALQFFEFKNGDVINWTKTTLNQNTDKFKNIVQFRNYYVEGEKKQRTGHKFFIFIEGEHQAFKIINKIRKEIGEQFELSSIKDFKLLWVLDFPLFEYDEESNRWVARHHPFTSPKPQDIEVMINNDQLIKDASKYLEHPYANIKANAYDIVLNGNEIGGGSIRIYQRELQEKMFAALGMTKEEAQHKFGFLLGAFEYGAPPHGGIAFGFDRLCAILGGSESIRDFIAFPKNNSGRDVMIDAPSKIDAKQLEELNIKLDLK
ncbi:MAG: amino acid--tRNA ligase-related protein, partial [Parafilimonas sp.]